MLYCAMQHVSMIESGKSPVGQLAGLPSSTQTDCSVCIHAASGCAIVFEASIVPCNQGSICRGASVTRGCGLATQDAEHLQLVSAYLLQEYAQQVSSTHHLSVHSASLQADYDPVVHAPHYEKPPLKRCHHHLQICHWTLASSSWSPLAEVLLKA